jgi:hypothetical protein
VTIEGDSGLGKTTGMGFIDYNILAKANEKSFS